MFIYPHVTFIKPFTSITADDKENGSETFGISVPVRKVNQNSRGSENQLLKGKIQWHVVCVYAE